MGTRNLTCVVKNGEYKVAKYCQWDGYPDAQGQSVVDFLIGEYNPKIFSEQIDRVIELGSEELRKRWEAHGADDSGFVTFDIANSFKKDFYFLDRDVGGGRFLKYIQETSNPEIPPMDVSFAADSLFCEWCYVIDLDTNQFEVYEGFNKEPLLPNERFVFLQQEEMEYYPVRLLTSFDISQTLGEEWSEWLTKYNNELDEEETE